MKKFIFFSKTCTRGLLTCTRFPCEPKRYMKTPSGRVVVVLPKLKLPALSLSPYPTGRDTSFIVCPTYSNFTSVTLTRDRAGTSDEPPILMRSSQSDEGGLSSLLNSGSKFWYFFHLREKVPLTYVHALVAADMWCPQHMDLHVMDRIPSLGRLWR